MNNANSKEFNNLYCSLSEVEKENFKNISRKLLEINFLMRQNGKDDYFFMLTNKNLFMYFFEYLGFDFDVKEDKELVYIKSSDGNAINNINKKETLCLLVLRLLYQEKLEEISLSDDVMVTMEELQNKLFSVGFSSGSSDRIKKTILSEMLRVFKQHNIIYYGSNDDISLDKTTIAIYPSIEVVMDFKKIEEIITRLELLKGGGGTDD